MLQRIPTQKLRELATSQTLYPLTQLVKRSVLASRLMRGLIRLYQNVTSTAPDILQELKSVEPAPPAPNNPEHRVLIFSLRGWLTHLAWETTIARALHLHNATTLTILCDKILPACEPRTVIDDFASTCDLCRRRSVAFLQRSQLPYQDLSQYVDPKSLEPLFQELSGLSLEALQTYAYQGTPIGELVGASVQRHLLQGQVAPTAHNTEIYRRFVCAGLIAYHAAQKLLQDFRPTSILLLNGLFYAEAIMLHLAKAQGITTWTYERANKRVDALIFAQDTPVIKYDFSAEWEQRSQQPLTPYENQQLDTYLSTRRAGQTGIENLWEKMEAADDVQRGRPLAVLFTNVLWDTAVYKADTSFDSMLGWLHHTVEWFRAHPQYQLVIRIHPAEIRNPFKESRSPVINYLVEIPANVRVFDAKETVDSYALLDQAQTVLVYTTTIGLEAVLSGKHTIVAGKTHYRGKGFTADPSSPQEFDEMLAAALSKPLNIGQRLELARRFAYLFFFQTMIPFSLIAEAPMSYPSLTFSRNNELDPQRNIYTNAVVRTLLYNRPPKNPNPHEL